MQYGHFITYVAADGKQYNALVLKVDQLHPGYVSLVAIEGEGNPVVHDSVPHMSDPSKDENNPTLPRYALNCWKEYGEEHEAPPADHPMFAHKFPHPVTNPSDE